MGVDSQYGKNAIITAAEINSRHGTGLLLQYIFGSFENIQTISRKIYGGERIPSASHLTLDKTEPNREKTYTVIESWFKSSPPKYALIVPFHENELFSVLALRDLFGVEYGLYIMDDNCIVSGVISDAVMQEAIVQSNVCWAISPEMKAAYDSRYQGLFHLLPPVVPDDMIFRGRPSDPVEAKGLMLGNVWNLAWLEKLRCAIAQTPHQLDWYCNDPIKVENIKGELEQAGIYLKPPVWGDQLVCELRRRPFLILPTSNLENGDKQERIARLSLPSRLTLATAVGNTPIIVVGAEDTAAAHFVRIHGLGVVSDYSPGAIEAAINHVGLPDNAVEFRINARRLAENFSAKDMETWIWQSIEQGSPLTDRFLNRPGFCGGSNS